jgi:TRAP-type C4-dicarboxylate transport system substrate-binding protein
MKNCLALLIAVVLLVSLGIAAGTTPAPAAAPKPEPIVLKTIGFSPAVLTGHSVEWIRDRLYARSQGRLVVDFRGTSEALPMMQQFEALRKGIIDMNYAPAAFHATVLPEMHLIHLAELSTSGLPGPGAWNWLNERYEGIGVRFLGALKFCDPWYVGTTKRVNSLDDLKKLLIVATSPPHMRFIERMGATAVQTKTAEMYSAIERRLAAASVFSTYMHSLSLHKVLKYIIAPSYKSNSNTSAFMNLNTWNRLGPELQRVVNEVMTSFAYDGLRRDLGVASVDMQVWLNAGVEVIHPFTAAEEKWYKSLYDAASWASLQKALSPEEFKRIQKLTILSPDTPKLIRP